MKKYFSIIICMAFMVQARAQTDMDAIMMYRHNICTGLMYQHSSWKDYWEGTFKRNNANLGTVTSEAFSIMSNYGITNKLNVMVGLPYISNKASAGQLHPMKGLQDFSLWLKWMPVQKSMGKSILSLFTLGGYSLPVTNYTADFLPMSVGLGSKNISLRAMADIQHGDWFATASATYVARSNVAIDREAYYTTAMHYTNQIDMPDAAQYNLRAGYRTNRLIAELLLGKWTTLGGFDITKNNMPFPSNKMNMTTAGFNIKYEVKQLRGLSLIGGGNYTLKGRNVGQATSYNAGIFYAVNLAGK